MLDLWPLANEIVQVIASAPGITARQLCNYFGWKRNTKQNILHRLVEDGYLVTKTISVIARDGRRSRARAYWIHRTRVRK
jgi:DNA-binding MarR family transcriptional regulator